MAHPRDKEINDPDTRSWWHYPESLSGDDMEGRDVGSPAYGLVAKVANDDKKPEWIK